MHINKRMLLGSTAAMVALSPLVAQQVQAATATVGAQALIVQDIVLSNTQTMDFGALAEAGAGTAVLNFTDNVTAGVNITEVGGSPSSGHVDIKASIGLPLLIVNPDQFTLTHTAATDTMLVNSIDLRCNGVNAMNGNDLVVSANGATETLDVGGTLNISNNQNPGLYTGSFSVVVTYQ